MPTITTIRVDGLQELGRRMRNLSNKVATRSCARATGAAAQLVKKAAKTNILTSPSVRTRTLFNAVIVKKLRKSQSNLTSEHIVTVRRKQSARATKTTQQTAPYAPFVEHGTVNMPAEPFLEPALSHNVQPAINVMKDTLTDEIIKAGA